MTDSNEITMRALTWKEPYASAMLHGKLETRPRPTKVRGPVLICSGLSPFKETEVREKYGNVQADRVYKIVSRPYTTIGKAIAVGNLVDCRPMAPADEDACFVAYNPLFWVWVFEDVRPIMPIPFKGSQGWTILTSDFTTQIKYIQL